MIWFWIPAVFGRRVAGSACEIVVEVASLWCLNALRPTNQNFPVRDGFGGNRSSKKKSKLVCSISGNLWS